MQTCSTRPASTGAAPHPSVMAAAAAAGGAGDDAAKYAESLRLSLISELFDGEDVSLLDDDKASANDAYTVEDYIGSTSELQDIDRDLDEYQDHEFIKGILEHGRVLKEYARDIDEKLRTAEMESIQEYIQESDNMVALHDQVSSAVRACMLWCLHGTAHLYARLCTCSHALWPALFPRFATAMASCPTWSSSWASSSQTWARSARRFGSCRCDAMAKGRGVWGRGGEDNAGCSSARRGDGRQHAATGDEQQQADVVRIVSSHDGRTLGGDCWHGFKATPRLLSLLLWPLGKASRLVVGSRCCVCALHRHTLPLHTG